MSQTLISQPLSEPFGQRGVGRTLFRAVSCSSLVLMVLSLGMWARSHHIVDSLRAQKSETNWYLSSIYGRILIAWGEEAPFPMPGEVWTYDQQPFRPVRDGWESSIYKRIGIEWRNQPINTNWGSRGGWVRIRWPFVAALACVLPLVRMVSEHRRRRAVRRLERGLCPRCGTAIRNSAGSCPRGHVLPYV